MALPQQGTETKVTPNLSPYRFLNVLMALPQQGTETDFTVRDQIKFTFTMC